MENCLMTRTQIAEKLNISRSTLYSWLKKEEMILPKGRYLKPSEYKEIFTAFGLSNEG